MLHQLDSKKQKIKISPNSRAEVLSAIDNKMTYLNDKFTWLKTKWGDISRTIGDCHEVRIIGPVIVGTLTPLNASIIVDNFTYFKEKCEINNDEQNFKNFQVACLCGSENIADFLLEKLKIKPEDSIILTYVSASQNEEWSKKIALEMKKKDLSIPGEIYLYCTETNIKDTIKGVFNTTTSNTASKI